MPAIRSNPLYFTAEMTQQEQFELLRMWGDDFDENKLRILHFLGRWCGYTESRLKTITDKEILAAVTFQMTRLTEKLMHPLQPLPKT
jgi:hypothetical protein